VLRGGRVVRSGPARGGWNRPSRCREPGEDAQPKRQRRPTNRRPHGNATGLETRATEEEDGPGDPCYGGRKRAWRPVLRGVGWCGAGQPAADGIALRAAGSRVKMHSQNGSAAPPIAGHTTMRRGWRPALRRKKTGLETRPTGERATGEGTDREDACYEMGLPRRWLERLQGDYCMSFACLARLWSEIIMSRSTA
jgi:hypothetical protein